MPSEQRAAIPQDTQTKVLVSCARRCCICYGLQGDFSEKAGQIAHLDQDRTNHREENLVWLCLAHHDSYDSQTSQSKGLTRAEVIFYRAKLHEGVRASLPAHRVPEGDDSDRVGQFLKTVSANQPFRSTLLNGSEIQRACEAGLVKIDPFSAERIKVTGYQLSLGHEAVMRGDRLKVTEQSGFILGVGSLAVISSLETVVLPQWLMGRIVAHHGSGHELTVYSTTIDPGFKGNILVGVENKMQYLPLIKPGTPFATLELSLINVPPSSFLAS